MVINLSQGNSLVNVWMREIRDISIQKDRLRFRRNLARIGEIAAYEISKTLEYKKISIETPLATHESSILSKEPVLATILRAGLPLHEGVLNYFDHADCAFIAAFRKHHKSGLFEIQQEYITSPDINGRPLIISDPMLATGASLALAIESLLALGTPSSIHIVVAIAAQQGIDFVYKKYPDITIWAGDIDDELTAKGYIVPGLGDAGDLCFGDKMQS